MIKSISISAIADLHGHLQQMQGSDLAVVAGDIFPGALDKDLDGQEAWFRAAFLPWVNKQECNHVILVAGNHDHWIAKNNDALMKEFAPEQLKKLIYLCDSGIAPSDIDVIGRNSVTGLPIEVRISYKEIARCLNATISRIEDAILRVLQNTPPSLYPDIVRNGIWLAGGGALLRGISDRFSQKVNIPFHVAEDPLRAVARGTCEALKNIKDYKFLMR